jgi:methylphosphotriester-DNA--protein-cysteine methyltransferase
MTDKCKCLVCDIEITPPEVTCPSCEKDSDECVRFYQSREGSLEGGKSPCLGCEAPTLRKDGLCRACARASDKAWDEYEAMKVCHDPDTIESNPADWPRKSPSFEDAF